ncbi:hydrogenobyrinic acid a,c-diamide synthase (glutamine-hydrolysing) /cobyrinate a,c-diamide synthase [Rhizobium subbaraonis]|uniref:Hydrogenobyrinate a,c-diamide synthase n=1 Tax=Rhizobium subbaraonis TaxID=908946 RepID=A0A285ULP3_9HYPH|nr:cobyrinate a,c-diamide synthase [Rhizobium subbaraonis]SOC42844.1 hydrogenobyrinic acid a,c-diamide synthase (glutamine-hydrolysing) /cobyrinate a,c-diamide synthase [Rhizobium subbaraonis]
MSGLMIAAPASGSGKTTVTLGLLRALADEGVMLSPGKAGPDYIDPAFHAAASRSDCLNYDPWAMRPELLATHASEQRQDGRLLLIEAMMGLFDGAADGSGAPADLAAMLGLPVVLVVDCSRLSHSVAAMVRGFADFRADISVRGVILNKVGSARHEAMLRDALGKAGMSVLGAIPRDRLLALPERHLGLVQAGEHGALEDFIRHAAETMRSHIDLRQLLSIAGDAAGGGEARQAGGMPPLGQRIAVARDNAFAFLYPHLVRGWQHQGAQLDFFSPLRDEAPQADCDAVFLPGGYPELHGDALANAGNFRKGMLAAVARGARIYGECGGYMTLGEGLISADGTRHRMLGLLPLVTSFAERRRHLGYRRVVPLAGSGFEAPMTAHEFHYSTVVEEGAADRVFRARDAAGQDLGMVGLRRGSVCGSYMHLIDLAAGVS